MEHIRARSGHCNTWAIVSYATGLYCSLLFKSCDNNNKNFEALHQSKTVLVLGLKFRAHIRFSNSKLLTPAFCLLCRSFLPIYCWFLSIIPYILFFFSCSSFYGRRMPKLASSTFTITQRCRSYGGSASSGFPVDNVRA